MQEALEKIIKTNERKDSYLREIADDKATLELINIKEEAGDPMPYYSPYTDYSSWKEVIQKEIQRAKTTLANLEIGMVEAETFQYYIANYTEM